MSIKKRTAGPLKASLKVQEALIQDIETRDKVLKKQL
jgi:hypothetical protein